MFARVFGRVWQENLDATQRVWHRLLSSRDTRGNSRAVATDDSVTHQSDTRPDRHAVRDWGRPQRRSHRKAVGGAAAVIGVLALTYSAASALVNGATGSSSARSDYTTVMQAASAEYRRARAECLALPFERRDACIAEAHANEGKMRNAAVSAPRKQLSQMRKTSDKLLLAAQGLDSIVIEPACNVVARGSASVCEIQVKGRTPEAPEAVAMVRTPMTRANTSGVTASAIGARSADAASVNVSMKHVTPTALTPSRTTSDRHGDQYFRKVAVLASP